MVTEEIRKALDISKVEDSKFRFTGIDVEQFDDRIEISMDDYAASLEDIAIREDKSDEKLNREEMRVLRKYVGKLSWLCNHQSQSCDGSQNYTLKSMGFRISP